MIEQAIKNAGAYMLPSQSNDAPAIREALSNMLDNAEKQGYKVNHSYNQERAVKRVQNLLNARNN